MKRILVYATQMEAVGGIESHVTQLCLRLAKAGHRVTLMSSRFARQQAIEAELARAEVELIVNRHRWSCGSALAKWLWTLLALVRLVGRRFAVVYTNGQGRNPAIIHAWYRGRTRLVHHHHTACDAGDIATWSQAYAAAMARADVLVVCAHFIRHRMREAIGRADVDVVYCFSRAPVVQVGENEPREHTDRVVFGYFGRLIKEKGIDWILRLSREPRLQAISWMIWGPEGAYTARDFDGLANVAYGGSFSSHFGLSAALERLHCYCLFSTHPEGIPVSLLEVMAAGKPWMASPQGGIPELVHDADSCVIVPLNDYEGVVSACQAMLGRIRSGTLDGARQREFYRTRFGAEMLFPRWSELLFGDAG